MLLSRAMKIILLRCSLWDAERLGSIAEGSRVFLFVHLTVCALCCVRRNDVMFDHVRSGLYVVGIQSLGFECGLTFEMLLYGKKRNMFVHSVQFMFRC